MKSLSIVPLALAAVLAVSMNSTALGFMAIEIEKPLLIANELSEMVQSLRQEVAAGETPCEEMLSKLDAALERIDDKLDQGVINEDEYLDARDEISSLRYDLECVTKKATKLTQIGGGGMLGGGSGGGRLGGNRIGGGGGGGGSVMGGAGAGGGLGGLLPLGVIGGTIAAATDDDKPGVNNCVTETNP